MNLRNPAALSALANGDIDNAIVAATPGGIEAQEKAGQALLVASSDMPKELRPSREAYEKVGFIFGTDIDEIFIHATLPLGWKRQATEHSMWSHIVDEKGRQRVAIFYKAAFYDRRASARLECRYSPWRKYPEGGRGLIKVGVSDCGEPIWAAGETSEEYDRDVERKLDEAVAAYLKEHYPNSADPTAYWD